MSLQHERPSQLRKRTIARYRSLCRDAIAVFSRLASGRDQRKLGPASELDSSTNLIPVFC